MLPLRVAGNQIVDSNGAPVLLRGVNRSGLEYSPAPIPEADFDAMIGEWGANIIRLPFNQEWALTSDRYLALIDGAVNMAARRGAYTLLDLQWLDAMRVRGRTPDGDNYVAPLPDAKTIELWRKLSAIYRGNPAVLYDIFNEPHDPLADDAFATVPRVTPDVWIPWAQDLVDAVRAGNPDALIFVPGVNWAYDLSAYPIDGLDGVVYSTHVYSNKGDDWDGSFGDLAAVAPVFAGEWDGSADEVDWGGSLAAYFADRGIGWTAWSWTNNPLLMQNGAATPFGAVVREALGAR